MTMGMINQTASARSEDGSLIPFSRHNRYFLYLYAAHLAKETKLVRSRTEPLPDNLLLLTAKLLTEQVQKRLVRHLTHAFIEKEATTTTVRGRINVLKTQRRGLLQKGQIACRFNELSVNTPRNTYIRCALEYLANTIDKDTSLKDNESLRALATNLQGLCQSQANTLYRLGAVAPKPNPRNGGIIPVGRHEIDDIPVVCLAQLVWDLCLPAAGQGKHTLPAMLQDDRALRELFEKGIYGFYHKRLDSTFWRVAHGKRLKWNITDRPSPEMSELLPGMQTDIWLDRKIDNHCIIVDTKYNKPFLSGRFKSQLLRSEYLYQMFAYLKAAQTMGMTLDGAPASGFSGLFLHPQTQDKIFEYAPIDGHHICIATVNLANRPDQIAAELVNIIDRVSALTLHKY